MGTNQWNVSVKGHCFWENEVACFGYKFMTDLEWVGQLQTDQESSTGQRALRQITAERPGPLHLEKQTVRRG